MQATSRHRHLCSPRGLGVCGQAFAICNPARPVKQRSIGHTGNSYFPCTTAYNNTCGKAEQRPIDSSAYRPYPAARRSFASSVNIQSPKTCSRIEHLNRLKEGILPRITASYELFIDNHNLRLPFGSWLFAPFFRSNRQNRKFLRHIKGKQRLSGNGEQQLPVGRKAQLPENDRASEIWIGIVGLPDQIIPV